MSRQSDTIWDIALAEVKTRAGGQEVTGAGSAQPTESTVFFMGSRSAGKTTLIHRFQDRDDEPPKATTALEYAYSRHSRGQVKDVAHVWELGGGTFLTDLVKIFIVPSNLSSLSVVLVLDLSEPGQLWRTVDDLLRAARTHAVSAIAELAKTQKHAADALRQQAAERLGSEHLDKAMVDPFPLPLVIIGMKYDIFQNFDSEKRKVISKTMRFIAHYNVATLLFCSNKMDALMNRARNVINHLAYHTLLGRINVTDYGKPLMIQAGSDSLQNIGGPPVSQKEMGRIHARSPMELWEKSYKAIFPQEEVDGRDKDGDPAKDKQYAELAVDAMRAQKDQELEEYRRSAGQQWRDIKLGSKSR